MLCNNLTPDQERKLLSIARQSISEGVATHRPLQVVTNDVDAALLEEGCCFVTLRIDGSLRGCIGSLSAYQPLVHDVSEHAYAAAFKDPRFSPVSADEVPELKISISVLGAATAMHFASEQDLLDQIEPYKDGLILEDPEFGHFGCAKATFLPSVWDQVPDKQSFLNALKNKAGLPEDYWSSSMMIKRYATHNFSEQE